MVSLMRNRSQKIQKGKNTFCANGFGSHFEIVVLHSITKRSVLNMLVNTRVQVSIVNLASISWSFRDYTTPGHHFASSVIDCKIQVMML
ncbi:hypothetical protein RO3G_09543 [Rhizopus delemar RA 99-880]|uniref:Uncharacterized protein n=1 Tax=Rhizopus delemar (strain RA 99-880 / ATCC MYA-4621 / FGSC 9543 / NRRL 43880) TaxID=246409 RepID=I1C8Q3_RHIO9|nr:hypothetical protein RO3G_09543 [Rhizopus delemar RA 99-880]|eukprot:EIE84833.1 hypothetical protein RO3G_09543 [Rhizopus delemar RA 99-880]